MSKTDVFPYKDRDNSYIVVRTLLKPYGEESEPVVSVGCTLKGDTENPSWKVHIPMDMLERVALALYQRSPAVQATMALQDADDRHKHSIMIERLNSELRAVQRLVDTPDDEET